MCALLSTDVFCLGVPWITCQIEYTLVSYFCYYMKFTVSHNWKVLDLYVWLSYRLEESFPDRELASSQKAVCSM